MTGVKFSFFNLQFHAPFEAITAFDGQLTVSDYLEEPKPFPTWLDDMTEEDLGEVLEGLLENLEDESYDISQSPIEEIADLQSQCFEDLISANNLLFFQQKDFLERCPLKLKDGQEIFDPSVLDVKMGYGLPFAYDDEEEEITEDRIGQAFDAEIIRWEQYANLYQTGYAAATIMIHLEKVIISVFALLARIDPEKTPGRRQTNLSVIDGKIKILKDTYDLDFHLPQNLAETLMKARVARNNFAHGDWEKVSEPFENLTAQDLVKGANEFCNLLFDTLGKKYNDCNV